MKREYKKIFLIFISILWILNFLGCKQVEIPTISPEIKTDILIIYSNDSFVKGELVDIIIEEFENLYECTVILRSFGDSDILLNRLIFERENPQADIAIGILSTQIDRVLRANIFMPNDPDIFANISDRSLILDRRHRLIPYNYDYYAFVYDTEVLHTPPVTFGEMQSSIWNHKILVTDPRISSTGQGLLMWSLGIFGERGFDMFWSSLKSNILTVSVGQSEAYIAFQAGEAPIILSYITTPFYHIEVEKTDRFSAYIPLEGRLKEIEFAGILNGSENLYLARRFIEFMLSYEFQSLLPTTLWKFPVVEGIELPESFANIQLPERDLSERIFDRTEYLNDSWAEQWMNIPAR